MKRVDLTSSETANSGRAKCPDRDKMLVEKVYRPKRTLFRQGQDDCGEQSRTMQGLRPFRAFLSCVSRFIGRCPMLFIQGLRPYLPVNDLSFVIHNSFSSTSRCTGESLLRR